jgi:Ca2+-binding EF-hand superfamily protein
VTFNDIKTVLSAHIENLDNEDLNEFMREADPNNTGIVTFDIFAKLCNVYL